MSTINAKSVKRFNTLPRKPRAPSGLVSNNWHFDLRYVPLDPTPSHFLFVVQLESSYIHGERVPLGLPANASGIAYFPETGTEAALEVAKALIHSFLDGFGEHKFSFDPPPAYAPWKLTTEDPTLAEAVGLEFKRLGVRTELCTIEVVTGKSLAIAQEAFVGFWEGLKKQMGITGILSAALSAPGSIVFKNLRLAPWVGDVNDDETNKALAYTQRLSTARPLSEEAPTTAVGEDMVKTFRLNMMLLQSRSNEVVRAEADAGNGGSAIDFSLRLQFGIKCTPDRQLSRTYLVKAIQSPTSTPALRSRAHALLVNWYTDACKQSLYYRYLHAAAHHANESALLLNGDASPAILAFAMYTLEPHSHQVLELLAQYKAVWAALEKRRKDIEKDQQKAAKKRAKTANKYTCAAVDCVIQSDKKMMLAQCSGKCDPDKKPSYCGKEDWKNHKPFCQPGAPCSILEKDVDLPVSGSKGGSLSIPVTGPDGQTMMVSSSTMGPEMLKEIREHSLAEHSQRSGPSRSAVAGSFDVEFGEIKH
ncbi:hypothetical protein FPV67DRAFT_1475810 [Lyophyllum atratum]|nr:hypothetical protein FPV67DRAFT_1475810 [Lyophyllum atratum]